MMLQWPQVRKTGNMQRKKLNGRGIAPHSEPLTKIHALRKERDRKTDFVLLESRYFNPRAPQGARHVVVEIHPATTEFQSTRSARSATPAGLTFSSP